MTPDNPMTETITHTAPLWRWTGGKAAWFFVTITGEDADVLAATALMRRLEGLGSRGFGSIRVRAAIGATRFDTSVFPQKDEGYILPVKASVRRAEDLAEGDAVTVTLEF